MAPGKKRCNLQIKSVSSTTILIWESATWHETFRIGNDSASIIDRVSAIAFACELNTEVKIIGTHRLANFRAHVSVIGVNEWGQGTNVVAFGVATKSLTRADGFNVDGA